MLHATLGLLLRNASISKAVRSTRPTRKILNWFASMLWTMCKRLTAFLNACWGHHLRWQAWHLDDMNDWPRRDRRWAFLNPFSYAAIYIPIRHCLIMASDKMLHWSFMKGARYIFSPLASPSTLSKLMLPRCIP